MGRTLEIIHHPRSGIRTASAMANTIDERVVMRRHQKHVDLQRSDVKTYDDLKTIVMKWAIARHIEKETHNSDVGTVEPPEEYDLSAHGIDDYEHWSFISSI